MTAPTIRLSLELSRDQTRSKYKLTVRRLTLDTASFFFLSDQELELLTQAMVDLTSSKDKLDDQDITSIKKVF